MKVLTKGDVIVNEIKVGDVHYEFQYGCGIKCEVVEKPIRDDEGCWYWKSKIIESATVNKSPFKIEDDKIQDYGVNEQYSHYGPNLYMSDAYGMFENRIDNLEKEQAK